MITVLFSCDGCGLVDKKVEIRFRRPDEEILHWMNHVRGAVARCHSAARPKCRSRVMKELKIPFHGDQNWGIGMDPELAPKQPDPPPPETPQ